MIGLANHYNPQEHVLLNPEMLDWCKRHAPEERRKSLFVYWSARYGTFVVGEWLSGERGLFVDSINLGKSLANFTRDLAQQFVKGLYAPMRGVDVARLIRREQSDELSRLQDNASEQSPRFIKNLFPSD